MGVEMKHILGAILVVGVLFTVSSAEEKPKLTDLRDRESYSLGYQFGKNLKYQGVDIDLDVYTSGIRDAVDGKTPLMTPEEIRSTINGLQQRLKLAQQEARKQEGEKNLAQGKAFLAANGKKDGVKTLESGLQCTVLTEGSGKSP